MSRTNFQLTRNMYTYWSGLVHTGGYVYMMFQIHIAVTYYQHLLQVNQNMKMPDFQLNVSQDKYLKVDGQCFSAIGNCSLKMQYLQQEHTKTSNLSKSV